MRFLVRSRRKLKPTDRRRPAQFLINALDQRLRLLLVGDSTDQRPGLRFHPHTFFADPPVRGPEPRALEPLPSPLSPYCRTMLLGDHANRRNHVFSVTGIPKHPRVVLEHVRRHRRVDHALALLHALFNVGLWYPRSY